MADLTVTFVHPTDGRVITVTIEDSMTGQEVIGELIANDFIPANPQGYSLAIKGGAQLNNQSTLKDQNVVNNTTIKITPATDAGYLTKK